MFAKLTWHSLFVSLSLSLLHCSSVSMLLMIAIDFLLFSIDVLSVFASSNDTASLTTSSFVLLTSLLNEINALRILSSRRPSTNVLRKWCFRFFSMSYGIASIDSCLSSR